MPPKRPDSLAAAKAIAHPIRKRVLDELARDEACASDLAVRLGISAPAMAYHCKRLYELGFLRYRMGHRSRHGNKACYYRAKYNVELKVEPLA